MQKLVWPTLALDYGRLPAALFANPSQLLGTALVALMAILACVFLARRFQSLRWGWGYFLLMLPVSGIVNTGFQEISTVVDHYQYLPLVAVGLILVPFVDGRRATLVALVLAVVAAGVARSRLSVWTDEARFYRDMIERNPNSFSAAIGLGNLAFKREDPVTAAEWYQKAIVQRPYDVVGLSNYAAALYAQKKFSLAYELRSTFSIPAVQKKMLANPVPTASFLTSVGSSAVELGHLEEGFKYICESARMIPENERFQRNVETVESLLKKPCPWRR